MKRRLHTILPDLPVNEAARLMRAEQIGFLPICDAQGSPLGVLTDRDIVLRLCAENQDGSTKTVSQIMTLKPIRCLETDTMAHAEELMVKHKTRRVLIIDRLGKLVGLVTLAEIAQYEAPYKAAQWLRELSQQRFRVEH